jgi:hypothetical protein
MRELKQLRKSRASGIPFKRKHCLTPVSGGSWHFSHASGVGAQGGDVELLFPSGVYFQIQTEATMGRGILLWLIGVPIPVIILLALVFHH